MKFILGRKIGMTQIFREDGIVVPVTKIKAGPCVITQVLSEENNKKIVQIGFGKQKFFRLTKPLQGHLKDVKNKDNETPRFLRNFEISSDFEVKKGDVFAVDSFEKGDKVVVVGISKGRGFQGVVKRHGFHGSPASHGHKDQLRMPGSIGATDAARVFKGTRMGGHMGNSQVTVKNLEVVDIDLENNEILLKGAVPGSKGGIISILSENGDLKIVQEQPQNTSDDTNKNTENVEKKDNTTEEVENNDVVKEDVKKDTEDVQVVEKTEEVVEKKETKEEEKENSTPDKEENKNN